MPIIANPEDRDFSIDEYHRKAVCKRCHCIMQDAEPLIGGGEYYHPNLDKNGKLHWCKNAGKRLSHSDKEIVPFVRKRDRKRRALVDLAEDYLPADISDDLLYNRTFPRLVSKMLENAATRSLQPMNEYAARLLSLFTYKDTTAQMLTATMIKQKYVTRENDDRLNSHTKKWHHYNSDWSNPEIIALPELTTKERLMINYYLPQHTTAQIEEETDIYLKDNGGTTAEYINEYRKYYRQYPYYAKIMD